MTGGSSRRPGFRPGSPGAWRVFEWWFRPWLRRNLAEIHMAGLGGVQTIGSSHPTVPLVLVANHTSWYDGFLLREVHRQLRPHAPLRTLMLQRELEQNPVLRFIGGAGFDPERPLTLRGALAEIRDARAMGVTLSFFPQGRIYPSTRRPLGFARGVEGVLRALLPALILPVALHLEMGNKVRPTAWIGLGELIPVHGREGIPRALELEAVVQNLLDRTHAHLAEHGESAGEHWPPKNWPRGS